MFDRDEFDEILENPRFSLKHARVIGLSYPAVPKLREVEKYREDALEAFETMMSTLRLWPDYILLLKKLPYGERKLIAFVRDINLKEARLYWNSETGGWVWFRRPFNCSVEQLIGYYVFKQKYECHDGHGRVVSIDESEPEFDFDA